MRHYPVIATRAHCGRCSGLIASCHLNQYKKSPKFQHSLGIQIFSFFKLEAKSVQDLKFLSKARVFDCINLSGWYNMAQIKAFSCSFWQLFNRFPVTTGSVATSCYSVKCWTVVWCTLHVPPTTASYAWHDWYDWKYQQQLAQLLAIEWCWGLWNKSTVSC